MSYIVYQKDPRNGYRYAYRAESYRDPISKKPRSRRVYLGRVDETTGEILPKGSNGKRNRNHIATVVVTDDNHHDSNHNTTSEDSERYIKCLSQIRDLINELLPQDNCNNG